MGLRHQRNHCLPRLVVVFLLRGVGYLAHALFLSGLLLFGSVQAAESERLWHQLLSSGGLNKAHLISQEAFRRLIVSKSETSAACNFPARTYLAFNNIKLFEQEIAHCDDLNEFRRRVPFQELSLVFAAEDIEWLMAEKNASVVDSLANACLAISGMGADSESDAGKDSSGSPTPEDE